MTAELMSRFVETFLQDANRLQWRKNKDYHPDDVAFLEILRTAWECGITVEQDLWAKIRKQYVALRSYALTGMLESEPPRQRMIDIAVYMGMFAFWDANKVLILQEAAQFVRTRTECTNTFICIVETTTLSHQHPHHHLVRSPESCCERCQFLVWLECKVEPC